MACLRVSSVNVLQIPSTRIEESIVESREVHIKHLLDTSAIKTGAKILSGRFVDAHKEKSMEFATYKDPAVVAAASDLDNTSSIDLVGSQEWSQHHVLRRSGRIRSSFWNTADLHRGICRTQSESWSTLTVAMPESERRQTERERERGEFTSWTHCCRRSVPEPSSTV